ncbi:hypothetical protein [Alkalicoccus chagannorensis]|nr:hypothetical protein [Alkalicoccus chagannorensis]
MPKRKRRRKWLLLFRREEGYKVWRYEPLRKDEINARKRQGWRVWH